MDEETRNQGGETNPLWCPSCLGPVGSEAICPRCQLPQMGPEIAALRIVRWQLHEVFEEKTAALAQVADIERRRALLTLSLDDGLRSARRVGATDGRDDATPSGLARWRPERIRDTLLWLGATLLGLSALTFAIVAWTRLAPEARAAVLGGITIVAGSTAVFLHRRLRATAEALMALTGALLLVDWYAIAKTSIGAGVSVPGWWAIGCTGIAVVMAAASTRIDLHALRIVPALLAPVAGSFAVAQFAHSGWTAAMVTSGMSVGLVVFSRLAAKHEQWAAPATIGRIAAALGAFAAFPMAMVAVYNIGRSDSATHAALAVFSLALPPGAALMFRRGASEQYGNAALGAIATASIVGGVLTLASATLGTPDLLLLAAGLGLLVLSAGALSSSTGSRGGSADEAVGGSLVGTRAGAMAAGVAAIGIPAFVVARVISVGLVGPLRWWSHVWSGSLASTVRANVGASGRRLLFDGWSGGAPRAAALAAAVGVGALLVRRASRSGGSQDLVRLSGFVAAVAFPCALTTGLLDTSVGIALLVEASVMLALVAAGTIGQRRDSSWWQSAYVGAAVLAVPVSGWSVVEDRGSIALTAVLGLGALAIACTTRSLIVRRPLFTVAAVSVMAETGVVVAALTQTGSSTLHRGPVGLAVTIAAGVVLLGARLIGRRAPIGVIRETIELAGVAGMAFGVLLATPRPFDPSVFSAYAFTAVMATFGLSSLRRQHAGAYLTAAAGVSLFVLWSWLAVAHVQLVEWYTVPAAVMLIGLGLAHRTRVDTMHSWTAYGVGLALGFGPSVVIALRTGGAVRPIVLIAAAFVAVLLGVRSRLQAPIVAGAATLVVLAGEGLGPVAADIPRWALLGTVGVVVLWLGASADRRLEQLHRWRVSLDQLR